MRQDYFKIKTAIRYWLLGRGMIVAHEALEFGLTHHTGVRKDGSTPEFQHQISQANFARTLIGPIGTQTLMYPEETLATIFLHDVVEDCNVHIETIFSLFGPLIGEAVALMTNHVEGVKKDEAAYYDAMQYNAIASLAKGCDRMHNHQSMPGVFTKEKQLSYIKTTNELILPMLKNARKRFPVQEPAYQNIKYVLRSQIEMLEHLNA